MKQTDASLRPLLDAIARPADLLELVRELDDEAAIGRFSEGETAAYRARFGPAVLEFIAEQERTEADALRARTGELDGEISALLGENRWGAYGGMARALELADLAGSKRLAMVGCGPFPDSLFCLHDRTSVPELVGFDRDPDAVAVAASLARALGLDRIRIEAADAAGLDYGGFDAICCSVFATPRHDVLARIAATAPVGATVIVREPVGASVLVFEPVLDDPPAGLELLERAGRAGGPLGLDYATLLVTESRNERSMKPSGTRST